MSTEYLVFGHKILQPFTDADYQKIKDWDGKQLFWLNRKIICPFQSTCKSISVLFLYDAVRGRESMTFEISEPSNDEVTNRTQYVCVPIFKNLGSCHLNDIQSKPF